VGSSEYVLHRSFVSPAEGCVLQVVLQVACCIAGCGLRVEGWGSSVRGRWLRVEGRGLRV